MTVAPSKPAAEQNLADEIWQLMTAQGALYAVNAPIRQSLENLVAYLSGIQKRPADAVSADITAALADDPRFTREDSSGAVVFVTSRMGGAIAAPEVDTHSFKQRLHDPEKPLPIDDISVVVSTSRPAITTVEPVFISDYWQIQAGLAIATAEAAGAKHAEVKAAPDVAVPAVEEPAVVVEPVDPAAEEPAAVVEPVDPAAEEPAAVAEAPVPVPVPVVEVPVVRTPQPTDRGTIFTLPDGTMIDLRRPRDELLAEHGTVLARILAETLDQEPMRRVISFGRTYYPESSLVNLGKNDLRKIRDYIVERAEPLLDTELIADLYYHNPRQSDYEGFRFSLNYRLLREKDFEFVGTEGANLWSARGLAAIGGKRIKASEMGQITSYLMDADLDDSPENQSPESIKASGRITRLLTFFEWEHGVLPFDASIAALVPAPMLSDQRSAVLRFESPQHYTTYLVEVRYPTGNRGGWLQGLDEFFHEHLVPGAMVTIARTDAPNVFTISYEEGTEQSERLLTLDEKKNKFAFANLTYYCSVDEDWLPAQSRFGRLKNLKSFPMGERRKAEMVLEHVFEVMGEQAGSREAPRYALSLDELMLAYNVLRPGSRALLQSLLAGGDAFKADEATPGLYYYAPEPTGREDDDDKDEDNEDEGWQPARRRYGRYDDDE